jgi:hypothetical protein
MLTTHAEALWFQPSAERSFLFTAPYSLRRNGENCHSELPRRAGSLHALHLSVLRVPAGIWYDVKLSVDLAFAARRAGWAQAFSQFIATLGLLAVIGAMSASVNLVPFTAEAYITAAYWFTASTSFANPTVTHRVNAEQDVFWDWSYRCAHWLAIPGFHRHGPAFSLACSTDGRACPARNSHQSRGRT